MQVLLMLAKKSRKIALIADRRENSKSAHVGISDSNRFPNPLTPSPPPLSHPPGQDAPARLNAMSELGNWLCNIKAFTDVFLLTDSICIPILKPHCVLFMNFYQLTAYFHLQNLQRFKYGIT